MVTWLLLWICGVSLQVHYFKCSLLSKALISNLWKGCLSAWAGGRFVLSLDKDVPHGLDPLVTIIWSMLCDISARVRVVRISFSAKSDTGIGPTAIVFIISQESYPCPWAGTLQAPRIEPFYVTVNLQGSTRYQRLPWVAAQRCLAVDSVGDHWIQWRGCLV